MDDNMTETGVSQASAGTGTDHSRDDTPDSATGAMIGGVGGALVGAAAGAILGPAGSAVGAAVGALTGAGAAGLAVDAVDQIDEDKALTSLDEDVAGDDSNIITPEMRAAQEREMARDDPNRAMPSTIDLPR